MSRETKFSGANGDRENNHLTWLIHARTCVTMAIDEVQKLTQSRWNAKRPRSNLLQSTAVSFNFSYYCMYVLLLRLSAEEQDVLRELYYTVHCLMAFG